MNAEKSTNSSTAERSTPKWVIGVAAAAVVAVGLYLAIAMPGMNHGGPTSSTSNMPIMEGTTPHALNEATPDRFAALLTQPNVFVVNVHTPYGGEIAGTDAFIPFDRVQSSSELPADTDQQILVYCRTGRMSKIAGEALIAMGYTNVTQLSGGMDAWRQSGRELSPYG
jgi:phage shock protein E